MPQNALEFFIGRTNARVVDLLETNRSLAVTLQGLFEQMGVIAQEKGVPLAHVKLRDVFIHEGPAGLNLRGRVLISADD